MCLAYRRVEARRSFNAEKGILSIARSRTDTAPNFFCSLKSIVCVQAYVRASQPTNTLLFSFRVFFFRAFGMYATLNVCDDGSCGWRIGRRPLSLEGRCSVHAASLVPCHTWLARFSRHLITRGAPRVSFHILLLLSAPPGVVPEPRASMDHLAGRQRVWGAMAMANAHANVSEGGLGKK